MKIFVDSANLLEIEEALERGFPSGITTNPSILAKEEKADFRDHINKIIELVQRYGYDIPLSVEVFSTRPDEMITQAEDFVRHFGHYPKLNVKVPVGWDELAVIRELRLRGIPVNCTSIRGSECPKSGTWRAGDPTGSVYTTHLLRSSGPLPSARAGSRTARTPGPPPGRRPVLREGRATPAGLPSGEADTPTGEAHDRPQRRFTNLYRAHTPGWDGRAMLRGERARGPAQLRATGGRP